MEAKLDAHYHHLNDYIDKISFGRHVLPVSLIVSPEDKYRARVAKQENVDALEKSMLTFGTLNDRVEVVLFLPANKAVPTKVGFKPPQTQDEMKTRGFEGYYTIVGDHAEGHASAAQALQGEPQVGHPHRDSLPVPQDQ